VSQAAFGMKWTNPWTTFLGHCPIVTSYLAGRPLTSPTWAFAHGLNTFLRAVGQPAFVDNPLLGLLILIAIFLPHPHVGAGCILGGGLATATELLVGLHPWGLVTNGVCAFNGVLTGTVIPILFPLFYGENHNVAHMWVAIAFGAIASVFVASAFNNFLSKFNVPYMALPFNLIITVIFLTLQPVSMDHLVKRDTSDLVEGNETVVGNSTLMDHSHHEEADLLEADLQISWLNVGRGIIVSMGQVYAVNDVPASLVMQLAVLLSSPLLFIISNTGAVIGSLLSLTFLPISDYQQVYDGIWGYNSLLSMAAVSCVFFPFSPTSLLAGALNAVATVGIQAALRRNMDTNHLPVFTLPMTLCTLVLLMAASERKAGCGGPPLARCKAMSFPEKQAREAWASTGEKKEEEEGNEEEKEPAIVDRV